MTQIASKRHFLLLQGPHGPFFAQLGDRLRSAGCVVSRVSFNIGDATFWPDRASLVPFVEAPGAFPDWIEAQMGKNQITDLVVYGEAREHHRVALDVARRSGVRTHILEEGYLRPYWITYERGGTNGNSALLSTGLSKMSRDLGAPPQFLHEAPATWGDMREHVFYGALYHTLLLLPSRKYRRYRPHRDIAVSQEAALHLKRLALMPWIRVERALATRRFRRRAVTYHLCLLQLDHDASVRSHSNVRSTSAFIETVVSAFAEGAPSHHHLVFKAHPLEDDRVPLRRHIAHYSSKLNVLERVHFLSGGKLAPLLNSARSAVTINSTAAQQALWRGVPVRALGQAVYSRSELVSEQTLPDFFRAPQPPDLAAYRVFRSYLLNTCQFRGGFYSAASRREVLPHLVDAMLDARDPFERLDSVSAAERQHIRLVQANA